MALAPNSEGWCGSATNGLVERHARRRLRSASVHLGTLTLLALSLTACDQIGDDDDCDSDDKRRKRLSTVAPYRTGTGVGNVLTRDVRPEPTAVLPERGGFGTHLASCGG